MIDGGLSWSLHEEILVYVFGRSFHIEVCKTVMVGHELFLRPERKINTKMSAIVKTNDDKKTVSVLISIIRH